MVGIRRFWGGRGGRRGTTHAQTPFDGGTASHPFVRSDVQSVRLNPGQVGVQISSTSRPAPVVVERPWGDIETLGAFMREIRNRFRRHLRLKKRTLQDLESPAPGLTSSPSTSILNNAQVGSSQDNTSSSVSGSSTNSNGTSSQPEYPLPLRQFFSAVSIKDGLGELQSILMFYDTMSTDNGVSEKLVSSHRLEPRPLLPKDLKTYTTANGDFTPTHYVEVFLKDPNQGINEYIKVVCSIWPSLQGYGLIGGLGFIYEHGIVLDPNRPPDIYVTTGKEADAAAREKQKKVYKSARKDNEVAKALLLASASTTGSLTAGTEESQEDIVAASSQTSAQQPDSQIGGSRKS